MHRGIRNKKVYQMAYKTKKRPERRLFACLLAERAGFEPAVGISPHTLSRRAT